MLINYPERPYPLNMPEKTPNAQLLVVSEDSVTVCDTLRDPKRGIKAMLRTSQASFQPPS